MIHTKYLDITLKTISLSTLLRLVSLYFSVVYFFEWQSERFGHSLSDDRKYLRYLNINFFQSYRFHGKKAKIYMKKTVKQAKQPTFLSENRKEVDFLKTIALLFS